MIYGKVTRQGQYPDGKDWCEINISRKSADALPHEKGKKRHITLNIGDTCYNAGIHETQGGQVWVSSSLSHAGPQKVKIRLIDALEEVGLRWRDKISIKKVGKEYYLEPINVHGSEMDAVPELKKIQQRIIAFRNKRDWAQFHDPKNLAEALSIEAGELLENFLWKTTEQSRNLSPEELKNVKEEIADIFIFLTYLSEEYEIDLLAEVEKKIAKNAAKYPVEKSKGSSKKYTDL